MKSFKGYLVMLAALSVLIAGTALSTGPASDRKPCACQNGKTCDCPDGQDCACDGKCENCANCPHQDGANPACPQHQPAGRTGCPHLDGAGPTASAASPAPAAPNASGPALPAPDMHANSTGRHCPAMQGQTPGCRKSAAPAGPGARLKNWFGALKTRLGAHPAP